MREIHDNVSAGLLIIVVPLLNSHATHGKAGKGPMYHNRRPSTSTQHLRVKQRTMAGVRAGTLNAALIVLRPAPSEQLQADAVRAWCAVQYPVPTTQSRARMKGSAVTAACGRGVQSARRANFLPRARERRRYPSAS